jgi:hypothetical protein
MVEPAAQDETTIAPDDGVPMWHRPIPAITEVPPPRPTSFVVTLDWLHKHATCGYAGWTAPQLAELGITWPAKRGWLKRMAGKTITEEQRAGFERAGAVVAARYAPRLRRRD